MHSQGRGNLRLDTVPRIVYTPIEVVDYLLHSADYVQREHFGKGLTDEGVHVLDPFTGTGTFITRLMQSGLIKPEDAARKFDSELHANEIVLLAYYIAAVNIEVVFQEAFGGDYRPFTGIVWTDTFQMTENEQISGTDDGTQYKILEFNGSVNSERAVKQVRTPIRVIVGNPPYSVGQESANDDNQNLRYPSLDEKIRATYAARSTGTLKRNLYDSYVHAIRWASDRIGDYGVIAFVTNSGFIDGNAMDGLRATFADEFSSIWVFNARGNQRTSGETSRQEGGKLFGSGSRAPIALTILAKIPEHSGPLDLHYHDIGDYLSCEQKLEIIRDAKSLDSVSWTHLVPNEQHDWINQRDPAFEKFPRINLRWNEADAFFDRFGNGVVTSIDSWVYQFSRAQLDSNVRRMLETFNDHIEQTNGIAILLELISRKDFGWLNNDPKLIKWSRGLRERLGRTLPQSYSSDRVVVGMYRPFVKQYQYLDPVFTEVRRQSPRMFRQAEGRDRAIYTTGASVGKPSSVLMITAIPNLHLLDSGQAFPLFWYEDTSKSSDPSRPPLIGLDQDDAPAGYRRHDGINTFMLQQYQQVYGDPAIRRSGDPAIRRSGDPAIRRSGDPAIRRSGDPAIRKEDIFYYIYGVLHSPEYRTRFESDLKKMLPRIPFTEDFWAFSLAGRELGELHVGYESVEPGPVTETRKQMPFTSDGQQIDDRTRYRVEKMRFGKDGKAVDKSVIVYNPYVTLSDIPLDAYDYIVNGKSALDWIMERYAITQDKESRIVNDPNEWSDDPRYIIDLVKRIVRVSIDTNRIVATLPALNERDVVITPR